MRVGVVDDNYQQVLTCMDFFSIIIVDNTAFA